MVLVFQRQVAPPSRRSNQRAHHDHQLQTVGDDCCGPLTKDGLGVRPCSSAAREVCARGVEIFKYYLRGHPLRVTRQH